MAADQLDEKWSRLMAMMERLSQPPTVNVNISMPDLAKAAKKKKQDVVSDPDNETTPDPWSPGGMPRPYVS